MPEGPSIVILKEAVQGFKGRKVLEVTGNTKVDKERLLNLTVKDFKSWGKHFLICFNKFAVRIHLMMFGSYRINERKEAVPRLSLRFANGELNFYTCSVQFIEGNPDDVYDYEVDIMSETWNSAKALDAIRRLAPATSVSDLLLNQQVFAGSGNIIKNEVLFRVRLHPDSVLGALPLRKKKDLVKATRAYALDFYRWKKDYVLRKHWLVYKKKKCSGCGSVISLRYTGANPRRTFYCENCQQLWTS